MNSSRKSYLAGTGATDKVISRSSSVGDSASPLALGVENDSVSTGRSTSKDTAGPRDAILASIPHVISLTATHFRGNSS